MWTGGVTVGSGPPSPHLPWALDRADHAASPGPRRRLSARPTAQGGLPGVEVSEADGDVRALRDDRAGVVGSRSRALSTAARAAACRTPGGAPLDRTGSLPAVHVRGDRPRTAPLPAARPPPLRHASGRRAARDVGQRQFLPRGARVLPQG